jgi:hypothetical protein
MKTLLATLAVTVLLGSVCVAQSKSGPLAVLSCASYDKLITDVTAIGEWCGDAGLGQRLQLLLLTLPQGDATNEPLAMDTARPWGAVLPAGKSISIPYMFLPVADIAPLVDLMQGQLGCTVTVEDRVYRIPFGRQTIYAVQHRRWAFLADSQQQLEGVAADPESLLGDLPKRYDLAIHASIRELPQEYRQQFSSQFCLDDMDDLLLGWNIDSQTRTSYVDLEVHAKTGSKLAERLAQVKPGKSNFFGLAMPNAAVTAIASAELSDEQVGQVSGLLSIVHMLGVGQLQSQGLNEMTFQRASRLLDVVTDVLRKVATHKKLDVGLAIRLDSTGGTLLAGVSLANAARLETIFQRATDEIPENDQVAKTIAIGAETYNGIHLHTISLAMSDRQLAPLVGDRLETAVGIADDKVLIAVGRDAVSTLKNAIDRLKGTDAKEAPPLKITVAVAPAARLLATVGEDPSLKANAAMLAGLFQNDDGKACVTLSAQHIPQGAQMRLRADENVLRALTLLAQMIGTYLPK